MHWEGLRSAGCLINNVDDNLWLIPRLHNLQEGMLMVKSFLTHLAVIKVLADRAFIPESNNWAHAAAIAFDSFMLSNATFHDFAYFIRFHEFFEDNRCLSIKLSLNELLDSSPERHWLLRLFVVLGLFASLSSSLSFAGSCLFFFIAAVI